DALEPALDHGLERVAPAAADADHFDPRLHLRLVRELDVESHGCLPCFSRRALRRFPSSATDLARPVALAYFERIRRLRGTRGRGAAPSPDRARPAPRARLAPSRTAAAPSAAC